MYWNKHQLFHLDDTQDVGKFLNFTDGSYFTFQSACCAIHLRARSEIHLYGLLTKREVKMAGYCPSSFFCVFMDRDEGEVHKLARKERGQYPTILAEQAWSIKDLLYGIRHQKREIFPAGQSA